MDTSGLLVKIAELKDQGKLLPEAAENMTAWASETWLPSWAQQAMCELVEEEKYEELNNRFYRQNEFGTAGIRGRTICEYTPKSEMGTPSALGAPQHAAVGSAVLNDFNILRATVGLYRYCQKFLKEKKDTSAPVLIIAYDVRHFSQHFAQLTASAWVKLGGKALLFDAPRSTPQLSFSVRHFKAHTGVVITASHNPAHDNGYKVYWSDGSQIVTPHDAGIIGQVNVTELRAVQPLLTIDISKVTILDKSTDEAYFKALGSTLIDKDVLRENPPRIVFSNVHGTGSVIIPQALASYGVNVTIVPEQENFDGRFPTVKSPNPQNAEALAMAMKHAEAKGVDIVLATDPDCDRMGAAVRKSDGTWLLLSGNTTGSLLAEDRLCEMKNKGWLPPGGHPNATVIKTFVTTPLQDAIAAGHGVQCVNCLTGFKWIGRRLLKYEDEVRAALKNEDKNINYDSLSDEELRKLHLQYSKWYVFGGEESYGYLGSPRVRDKDGNAAVLMFAEMLARLQAKGLTLIDALEALYLKYGYYAESPLTLNFEGASGALKIKKLVESYAKNPPKAIGDFVVRQVQDFARETIKDADGETVPKAAMIVCQLDDGTSFAIRPSGTEPTVKFYCFTREAVREMADLKAAETRANSKLEALKAALKADAGRRSA